MIKFLFSFDNIPFESINNNNILEFRFIHGFDCKVSII